MQAKHESFTNQQEILWRYCTINWLSNIVAHVLSYELVTRLPSEVHFILSDLVLRANGRFHHVLLQGHIQGLKHH